MDCCRTIQADADKKILFTKKLAPLLVQEQAVGLQRVSIACPGRAYFFCNATAARKKSSPISVGSPPCQQKLLSWRICQSVLLITFSTTGRLIFRLHVRINTLSTAVKAVRAGKIAEAGGLVLSSSDIDRNAVYFSLS